MATSDVNREVKCDNVAASQVKMTLLLLYDSFVVFIIIIIIIIILFKSGNKAHKHKQEKYRQTDRQYK